MEADTRRVEEGLGHKPVPSKEEYEHEAKNADDADQIGHEKEETSGASHEKLVGGRDDQPLAKPKTKRVATLDAFRGLTIVVCHNFFISQFLFISILEVLSEWLSQFFPVVSAYFYFESFMKIFATTSVFCF